MAVRLASAGFFRQLRGSRLSGFRTKSLAVHRDQHFWESAAMLSFLHLRTQILFGPDVLPDPLNSQIDIPEKSSLSDKGDKMRQAGLELRA